MAVTRNLTIREWENALGEQARLARIRARLDQEALARNANISVGAVKNLEGGKGSSLKTLIAVVRVLGRTDWLEGLAPRITVSPLAMVKQSGRATPIGRQRVRKRTGESPSGRERMGVGDKRKP
jgi:transcriptional regulator with XRE-family HTH domain